MTDITFISGNQSKADYLAKFLDLPIKHIKLDLSEIQSLDIQEVVDHKVREAYSIIKSPVLVEDVALEFGAFNRLPGTFIKFFIEEIKPEAICAMLNNIDRSAIAKCLFGYYDGIKVELFEGTLPGHIADKPAGINGFGWDKIFIPNGYNVTNASLSNDQLNNVYTSLKPYSKLKEFFINSRTLVKS